MKSVSRCIGLAFTINPYILQDVIRQITLVSLIQNNKMVAQAFYRVL